MSDLSNTNHGERVEYMLTTVDNPWDPWTQYDEWYAWDYKHGYHTPSLLARVATLSDDTSELDQMVAIQLAIDDIIEENVSGMHRKVALGTMGSQAVGE